MIDSILQHLPADVQADLAARTDTHLQTGLLRLRPATEMDDRLDTLLELSTMTHDELLASLARWTAYATYLGELVIFTTIVIKRIEHFVRIRQVHLRTKSSVRVGISNADLLAAEMADERMRALDDALQSMFELRAVLEHRERSCKAAAEAASRAITAHQTEVQRLRLEARRA